MSARLESLRTESLEALRDALSEARNALGRGVELPGFDPDGEVLRCSLRRVDNARRMLDDMRAEARARPAGPPTPESQIRLAPILDANLFGSKGAGNGH